MVVQLSANLSIDTHFFAISFPLIVVCLPLNNILSGETVIKTALPFQTGDYLFLSLFSTEDNSQPFESQVSVNVACLTFLQGQCHCK